MNITIKDHRNNIVLTTNDDNYREDILANADKLNNIWWFCWVEYDDGTRWFTRERRMVLINDKMVNAEWTLHFENGKAEGIVDKLLGYMDKDFGKGA